MKGKEKIRRENSYQAGAQIGNVISKNVQTGSDTAMQGMDLFRAKGANLGKVGYEQGKGNLFEFIEAAKLTKNMANAGAKPFDKFPVTDVPVSKGGYGEHTAPDDFRLQKDGKIIGYGQGKVNNDSHRAAVNFTNPKYKGMQRNTTIDSVPEIQEQLKEMLEKGEISKEAFDDAWNNLNGMLVDPDSGITSGGTTTEELKQFCGEDGKVSVEAVNKYAKKFEIKQYGKEIVNTSVNMAASSAVVSGIVSGVENTYAVLQNKKKLDEAIKDIGVDVVKGGARGGVIGALSSVFRIGGTKAGLPVLSDSSCATVIAAGVVESGVAIYEYARGEIGTKQLIEQLQDTTIKSTTTIYFTKAATCVFGATNPFIPLAIYSVANYVVASTREIINNAKLNAAEYNRLAELYDETAKLVKEFHKQLIEQLEVYEMNQRQLMSNFLSEFDKGIMSGDNCDTAIYAMINYANQTGIALQHTDFNEFSKAMISDEMFVLKSRF